MSRRRDHEALSLPVEFRQALHELRAEYDAGTTSRYLPAVRGTQSQGSGADYHYRNETHFYRMIERMRHFDRNNMVVGQGLDRLADQVIQDGFTLDPQCGAKGKPDKGLNDELKARWYDWADDSAQCDFEGEDTFPELEWLAFRSAVCDGDNVTLPLASDCLQLTEAHRMKTPRSVLKNKNCVHGVRMDEHGRPISYQISKRDIDPLATLKNLQEVTEYPRYDEDGHLQVLHLKFRGRKSQTRGVSPLSRAVFPISYHDDIQFAKLVQAQVASCFAILEQQIEGLGYQPPPRTGPEAQTGARTEEQQADGTTRTVEGMSPGMRVRAKEGWKLTGFSPNIPNPEFFPHAMLILTFVAINLGLPVHVLLLDPSKTNFSGWRGAIDQARKGFRRLQRRMIERWHAPIYRWKMRQWAASDAALRKRMENLSAAEFFCHVWNPPRWEYIEPLKDIQADSLETATSLTSRRRLKARRGEDWAELVPEIVTDNGMLIEAAIVEAKRINEKHTLQGAEKVQWREVAALPLPDGVSLAISPAGEEGSGVGGRESANQEQAASEGNQQVATEGVAA